jgi:hypothetical protein
MGSFFFYPSPLCFLNHYVSRDGSSLVRSIELASIGGTMTREEPSLETLWLQNIRTMDKVQKQIPVSEIIIY